MSITSRNSVIITIWPLVHYSANNYFLALSREALTDFGSQSCSFNNRVLKFRCTISSAEIRKVENVPPSLDLEPFKNQRYSNYNFFGTIWSPTIFLVISPDTSIIKYVKIPFFCPTPPKKTDEAFWNLFLQVMSRSRTTPFVPLHMC